VTRTLQGRSLAAGHGSGQARVLTEPLSLWGGMDPSSGEIVDAHHPQRGANLSGRVLVMPAGRGSSSSSSVLAEAVRLGTGPAAILIANADLILAVGAAVANELYGRSVPVVELDARDLGSIPDGAQIEVADDGSVQVD
jgi:predicted aconitase with swiveling domain